MAKENEIFFQKVVDPYHEIQNTIRIYKEGAEALLQPLSQVFYLETLLEKMRVQARQLKESIEDLDEKNTNNYSLYLSYIQPELDRLALTLCDIRIANRDISSIDELIHEVHISLDRINLKTFI
jgi:uncharacterized membrane protein